jgi:hypothetical protein
VGALLLAVALAQGCDRTTSLGRSGIPSDGPVERGTHDAVDDQRPPATDAQVDAHVDQGPIVGGGRDAIGTDGDGDSESDGDDDGLPADSAALPDAAAR